MTVRQRQYEPLLDQEGNPIGDDLTKPIPFSDFLDYRKLEYLVPAAQCNTRAGVITAWADGRDQPTYDEIEAVTDEEVDAAELEQRAQDLDKVKLALSSLAELVYENPDLQASFATVGDFKTALKDRYKTKL